MLNFPRKATNMINKQLQIDKSSSEKALDYKEEAARILQSSKTEDDLIEKYRKHFTCSHYPPVQSSLAQGRSPIEKKKQENPNKSYLMEICRGPVSSTMYTNTDPRCWSCLGLPPWHLIPRTGAVAAVRPATRVPSQGCTPLSGIRLP